CPVAIGGSAAMLRVVLPLITTAAATNRLRRRAVAVPTGWLIRRAVSTANVDSISIPNVVAIAIADVRVAVKVVVVIDIDVVVAGPSAPPTPTATPEGAHHDANTKRNRDSGRVVPGRRIENRGRRRNTSPRYHHRL